MIAIVLVLFVFLAGCKRVPNSMQTTTRISNQNSEEATTFGNESPASSDKTNQVTGGNTSINASTNGSSAKSEDRSTSLATSPIQSATTKYTHPFPETIPLLDVYIVQSELMVNYLPSYRFAYYYIGGDLTELVDREAFRKWAESRHVYDPEFTEPKEMVLVSFLKHFKISREQFDKENAKTINAWKDMGLLNTNERYEAPNADIIYTFDNDIINEYYRRER
jgi:hypothetical protein